MAHIPVRSQTLATAVLFREVRGIWFGALWIFLDSANSEPLARHQYCALLAVQSNLALLPLDGIFGWLLGMVLAKPIAECPIIRPKPVFLVLCVTPLTLLGAAIHAAEPGVFIVAADCAVVQTISACLRPGSCRVAFLLLAVVVEDCGRDCYPLAGVAQL